MVSRVSGSGEPSVDGATRIVSPYNRWSLNLVGLPTLPILLINEPCTIGSTTRRSPHAYTRSSIGAVTAILVSIVLSGCGSDSLSSRESDDTFGSTEAPIEVGYMNPTQIDVTNFDLISVDVPAIQQLYRNAVVPLAHAARLESRPVTYDATATDFHFGR